MKKNLHSNLKTAVYTSATLATGRNVNYFKQRLGISKSAYEVVLPPVFDYRKNALLYIPHDVPPPNDIGFMDAIVPRIRDLLIYSEGRSFVLFTSYSNMERAVSKLSKKMPFKIFVQGERPRNSLLEAFREDVSSVLFATSSFWEGVDVEGETLSQVIIDKLPFAVPSDPIVGARINALKDRGKNSFMEFQVPQAAIALRQGVGRLIRRQTDRGVLAILDQRIIKKHYGQYFLRSLPPAKLVTQAAEVEQWWNHNRLLGT